MRPAAPRAFLVRALRLVLLVDRKRDALAIDRLRDRHRGMRRLRKQWVIIVAAPRLRLRQIRYVDNAEAGMPAACPHFAAKPERVMEPVLAPGPARRLASCDMLP